MSFMMEIERKFLVNIDAFKKAEGITKPGKKIVQGYLNIDEPEISQVRVTIDDTGIGRINIKGNKVGFSRPEYQYDIPGDEAREIVGRIPTRIYKENYHIMFAGNEWCVQIFHDKNEGLAIAEIEIPSEDTQFEIPSWCGEEVTYNDKYYVRSLAKHPISEW